jgi:hypothetical protein
MSKLLPLGLAAISFGLAIAISAPAVAEIDCPAKTCSQALVGCYRHCPKAGSDPCNTFCPSEYANCMKTGDFNGKFCTKRGLVRK